MPVGRKAGGFVFHHTRNSAVTNLVASGMDQGDAMKVTGHQTPTSFGITTLATSRRSATSSPSDGRTWPLGRTGTRWSGCRYPHELANLRFSAGRRAQFRAQSVLQCPQAGYKSATLLGRAVSSVGRAAAF
jgi:hypothetical protein